MSIKTESKPSQVFVLIKPRDYSMADVEVFEAQADAEKALTNAKLNNEIDSHFFYIQPTAVQ